MNGRLAKDVHYLQRHVGRMFHGQAEVQEVDDNLEFVRLDIVPNDGLYKGARVQFKLHFSQEYPERAPQPVCLTSLYHPNIDPEGILEADEGGYSNVCVSLLDEWDAEMSLDHIVMALLFLFYNPAIDDALSPHFDSFIENEDFEQNVHRALRGLDVDGHTYDCLIMDEDTTDMCGSDENDIGGKVNDDSCDKAGPADDMDNSTSTIRTVQQMLNRQNSVSTPETAKDTLSDSFSTAVILRKDVCRTFCTQPLADLGSNPKLAFDIPVFPFVRTLPAGLSVSALFPGFQSSAQAFQLVSSGEEAQSEVD